MSDKPKMTINLYVSIFFFGFTNVEMIAKSKILFGFNIN